MKQLWHMKFTLVGRQKKHNYTPLCQEDNDLWKGALLQDWAVKVRNVQERSSERARTWRKLTMSFVQDSRSIRRMATCSPVGRYRAKFTVIKSSKPRPKTQTSMRNSTSVWSTARQSNATKTKESFKGERAFSFTNQSLWGDHRSCCQGGSCPWCPVWGGRSDSPGYLHGSGGRATTQLSSNQSSSARLCKTAGEPIPVWVICEDIC